MSRKPIMVHHEWGALKEVVVGVPNVRLPSKLAEAPKRFLPDSSVEFIEKNAGKRLQECAPDLNQKFIEQVDGIIKNQIIAFLRIMFRILRGSTWLQ